MENGLHFGEHIREETLEEYAFNRLSEEEAASIEEHLLVCEQCQEALRNVDEYIGLMKRAAAKETKPKSGRFVWGYVTAATVSGAIALIWIPHRGSVQPPETITLQALRGAEMAHIDAGRTAEFRIEVPDLADGEYRIEVVDAAGRQLWSGRATAGNQLIMIREPEPLKSGVYWVRLYSNSGALLREFGVESR